MIAKLIFHHIFMHAQYVLHVLWLTFFYVSFLSMFLYMILIVFFALDLFQCALFRSVFLPCIFYIVLKQFSLYFFHCSEQFFYHIFLHPLKGYFSWYFSKWTLHDFHYIFCCGLCVFHRIIRHGLCMLFIVLFSMDFFHCIFLKGVAYINFGGIMGNSLLLH